jgi:hypothetical protein
MPKASKEPKPRPKTFEDVFVAKPAHDHCKQVLASKRIRDCCFTGWDTSREPYFPEDKGCYYLAANLELCPTTGREHWQGIACFNTVQPATDTMRSIQSPFASDYSYTQANSFFCLHSEQPSNQAASNGPLRCSLRRRKRDHRLPRA